VIASLASSVKDGDGTTPGPRDVTAGAGAAEPARRTLGGARLELDAAAPAADPKTFGAGADDYYPTERRKHGTHTP
jgi:hypothetical protein